MSLGMDRFRSISVLPLRMAGTRQVRLLARLLSVSHEVVVYRLLNLWSWASGAWEPGAQWGECVPLTIVDALVAPGAAPLMARAGLGMELVVDGVAALRLERIDGVPDVKSAYRVSAQRRLASAGRWRRYHEQRAGRDR